MKAKALLAPIFVFLCGLCGCSPTEAKKGVLPPQASSSDTPRVTPPATHKPATNKGPLKPAELTQEEIAAAWEKAGGFPARLGPSHAEDTGLSGPNPGDMPAFLFYRPWSPEALARLPKPRSGFGIRLSDRTTRDPDLGGLDGLEFLYLLDLNNTHVTNATLKQLAGLKSVRYLDLSSTWVTDEGVSQLAGLKELHWLNLSATPGVTGAGLRPLTGLKVLVLRRTQLNDAGAKDLAGLSALELLNCGQTKLSDEGLKSLAGLRSLRSLHLDRTKVTDKGLKHLAGLRALQTLDLEFTAVGEGLKDLAGLESLQTLNLAQTQVTDKALKDLIALKSLKSLNLCAGLRGRVTDAGLKELAGCKSLQRLDLTGQNVTEAGVAELRKALPKLAVYRRKDFE
jgi:hypothetical protein